MYAENPAPHIYLTDTEGAEPLEDDDALNILDALTTAVTTHGTAYLAGLQINQVGWSAKDVSWWRRATPTLSKLHASWGYLPTTSPPQTKAAHPSRTPIRWMCAVT